jgi:hypothetical protein
MREKRVSNRPHEADRVMSGREGERNRLRRLSYPILSYPIYYKITLFSLKIRQTRTLIGRWPQTRHPIGRQGSLSPHWLASLLCWIRLRTWPISCEGSLLLPLSPTPPCTSTLPGCATNDQLQTGLTVDCFHDPFMDHSARLHLKMRWLFHRHFGWATSSSISKTHPLLAKLILHQTHQTSFFPSRDRPMPRLPL